MPKNPQEFAKLLGARIVGELPEVGGGPFGMARLARLMHKRLTPSQGERPGRPTDSSWESRPKVPMSEATQRRLAEIAARVSTPQRQVSPMQVAAQLLEEAVHRVEETAAVQIENDQGAFEGLNELPPALRILPMSPKEQFEGGRTAQAFLYEVVRKRPKGSYLYKNRRLVDAPGTVVLFQHSGVIIGSAILSRIERFSKTRNGYKGEYQFDVKSIRVFDPMSQERISKIWPEVKHLGQVMRKLDPNRYPAFQRELTGVRP